jgi:hypothetical protein
MTTYITATLHGTLKNFIGERQSTRRNDMNLKEAEKIWRDSQPIEANGMVGKKTLPRRWAMKLAAYKSKKKRNQDAQDSTT